MAQFEVSPESKITYPLIVLNIFLEFWDYLKPNSVDDAFKRSLWAVTIVYVACGVIIRMQKIIENRKAKKDVTTTKRK